MTTILRWTRNVLLNVFAVVGAICILVTVVCLVMGLRPAIVVSGSMEPSVPVGALTLAREVDATDVRVGDVVTLERQDTNGLVTHRVIATEPTSGGGASLTLQGDANDTPDPIPYEVSTARQVVVDVPWLGYVALWIQMNTATVVALLVAVTVLVVVGGRIGRSDDDDEVPSSAPEAPRAQTG